MNLSKNFQMLSKVFIQSAILFLFIFHFLVISFFFSKMNQFSRFQKLNYLLFKNFLALSYYNYYVIISIFRLKKKSKFYIYLRLFILNSKFLKLSKHFEIYNVQKYFQILSKFWKVSSPINKMYKIQKLPIFFIISSVLFTLSDFKTFS